jgi:heparan-alpha-glucosaminide N-acetyltransferase
VFNGGGYLTLSFIPTLGTMLLGLIAGQWMRAASKNSPKIPMRRLILAGVIGLALGLALHLSGICPIVKRIWTPAWTIFSGGACFLLVAAFSWLIEVKGFRRWAFPLVVIGVNSIAAYLMAHLFERFIIDSFGIHLGANFFAFAGPGLKPFFEGWAVLGVYWAMLYWMYRKKVFLRI